MLTKLFNIGRPIIQDSTNPYLHIAYKYKLRNYRLITDGEMLIRGKDLDIPEYVKLFINSNHEALMIANIIQGKVVNIVFRTILGDKQFIKLGPTKLYLYGIGDLDEDFKYGDTLLIVEGNLDRDVMKQIYPNTIAIMTNILSKTQVELLKGMTNKFIFMLDNDEAGKKGTRIAKRQFKDCNIKILNHLSGRKDAGELAELELKNKHEYEFIIKFYKTQIIMMT